MKTGIARVTVVAGPQNKTYQPGEKVEGDDQQMLDFAALGIVTLDQAEPPAQAQAAAPKAEEQKQDDAR